MDNKQPFDSINEGDFNQQDYTVKPEPNNNYYNEPNPNQFQEYPSKRIVGNKPKKSKLHIGSLIAIFIVILLILTTIMLPWYCISIGMSMFFFFPISMDVDMNFHLTEINLEADAPMNASDESISVSYSEIEEKALEQDKTEAQNLVGLFRNTTIFIVFLLIFSIISFFGVLCTTMGFGNKKTMEKIGLIFGVLTFILGVFTAGYFMTQWDSNIINKGLPDLDSDEDSSFDGTVDIFETEEGKNELKELGFWDSRSISMDFPESNDSNMSIIYTGESSSFSLFSFDLSFTPGLSWYIIVFASIMSLASVILLINKKLKIMLISLFICSLLLAGVFIYLSISVGANEGSSTNQSFPSDWSSWDETSDPVEVSKFIGTWELDVNNTIGHNEWGNITEETWIFWENETFNNYKMSTKYESGGSGSMTCSWSANNNILTACGDKYNYVFSDDEMIVTLTKDDEKVVLKKSY